MLTPDENKVPVGMIDFTPTWVSLVPIFVEALRNGTTEGYTIALEELTRMAKLADEFVVEHPKYDALMRSLEVDKLADIIRSVDGNNDLGAGALAEAMFNKLMEGQ